MSQLSIAMPFYRNPTMLAVQYGMWADYPQHLKNGIEIVIVDDGSPEAESAASVPKPEGLPALRLYRVLEDRLWHQHGARNLAAHEANGPWLFMTDMDHVLPAASLELLGRQLGADTILNRDVFYTFHRLDAPHLRPKLLHGRQHPHQNTFAVRKQRYWHAGGYDEDYCGFYGTDGLFLRRLMSLGEVEHLGDVPVVRYSRDVIPDASTRADREAGRRNKDRRAIEARKMPGAPVPVLQFPWERVS